MTSCESINEKIERNFTLDALRVIAILAVVMLHISANIVFNNNDYYSNFIVGNFFDSISRFAVPFFVIISGYFMLDDNKTFSIEKFTHKTLNLFILLIFWSAFYALVYDFHNFIHSFSYGHYHLWYMYLIIGLYLITPVLRLFINAQNKQYVYYLLALSFIFTFVPNIIDSISPSYKEANRYFSSFNVPVTGYSFYYIMGWIFKNHSFRKNINYIALILISFLTIFLGTQFIHYDSCPSYKIFYDPLNIPVLVYSCSLFIVLYNYIQHNVGRISNKVKNFITTCSKLSFGVYLIHINFLHLIESIFKYANHNIFYILCTFIIIVVLSFFVAYILSKTKYLKSLIKI